MFKKMNIHLMDDEKFIPRFITRFEKFHNYNFYIILNCKSDYSGFDENIILKGDRNVGNISQMIGNLISDIGEVNLFIHLLDSFKAQVLFKLKKKNRFRIYWVFYGGDLYKKLNLYKNYRLIDHSAELREPNNLIKLKKKIYQFINGDREQRIFEDIITQVDYFCFWNPYDYELLKSNFETKAKYKPFLYDHVLPLNDDNKGFKKEDSGILLVNHSASSSGNHITILKALNKPELRKKINKIIVPLSYGPDHVKEVVINYGQRFFPNHFFPLKDFIEKEKYYQLLRSVDIAFFGHRRQQGGFNIFQLLVNGTKVYLREENNLSGYFRDNGVKIGIFNENITEGDLVNDLSIEDRQSNRKIILELFSGSEVDRMYENL